MGCLMKLWREFSAESLKSVRKSFARLEQLPMHDPRRSSAEAHLKRLITNQGVAEV